MGLGEFEKSVGFYLTFLGALPKKKCNAHPQKTNENKNNNKRKQRLVFK
jgi:hypothetical protein